MRSGLFILFFISVLSTYTGLINAQSVAINNIIATDFTSSPDDVIEIDFGDHLVNVPFVFAWIDSTGKRFALPYKTGSENLIIPIGRQAGWKGKIGLVGLSVNNVTATFRKVGVSDIWSSFLTKFPLSPGSVNFSGAYFLHGTPFRWICAGLMAIVAMLIYAFKRRWDLALLIGFCVAWGAYDLRSGYNRWEVMNEISDNDWHIPILQDLQNFLPKAREIIGPDGSWTKEQLSGFLNSYCTYELADLTYYPRKSEEEKNAQYTITTQPRKRQVVLTEGPYHLVKNR